MRRACLLAISLTITTAILAVSPATGGARRSGVARTDWLVQARQQVARAEYRFSPASPGVFSAPNRALGLRMRADARGVRITPRQGSGSSWRFDLSLTGFGREGDVAPVGVPEVRAEGEKVEARRRALGLTEWYVNASSGIEQGFTIDAPPAGGERGSSLVLEMALSGGRIASGGADGGDVTFSTDLGEEVLQYGALITVDASGTRVPSTLQVTPGGLRISVRDQGHPYPLVVDPTIVTASWTALGDQFDERFGAAVAGAGDVDGDGFDDVLVGAYQYDGGVPDEGKVFLFRGSSSGPSLAPDWTFEPDQRGAWAGYSVAPAGDVNGDGYADVVVGAPLYDGPEIDEGRVFLFLGSPAGLGATPAWSAEIDQSGARFGSSVASAGDVNGDGYDDLIVGAPGFDNGQNTDEGRAYVYLGSATGPAASPVWNSGSGLFSSGYGTSVAGVGDVNGDGFGDIVVGAPLYDAFGFFDEGRAYLYLGSASGPGTAPAWTADGSKNLAQFGQSVAAAGDVNRDGYNDVIIGAPTYDTGRVTVYQGSAAGLSTTPSFSVKFGKGPADFGASVAGVGDINGDGYGDIAIGAPKVGDRTNPSKGLITVYFGGRGGIGNPAAFTVSGSQANEFLGGSVAAAGDVNGDSLADIIAGGIGLDNAAVGMANSGGAELFLGFRNRQTTTLTGGAENAAPGR